MGKKNKKSRISNDLKVQSEHQSNMQVGLNMEKNVENVMPRCSSFEDLSSLPPSSETIDNDPSYALWKSSFGDPCMEPKANKRKRWRLERGIQDMSSAITGNLTPKKFISRRRSRPSQRLPRKFKCKEKDCSCRNQRPYFKSNAEYFCNIQLKGKMLITCCCCINAPPYFRK